VTKLCSNKLELLVGGFPRLHRVAGIDCRRLSVWPASILDRVILVDQEMFEFVDIGVEGSLHLPVQPWRRGFGVVVMDTQNLEGFGPELMAAVRADLLAPEGEPPHQMIDEASRCLLVVLREDHSPLGPESRRRWRSTGTAAGFRPGVWAA
jgi:hypothetical protein